MAETTSDPTPTPGRGKGLNLADVLDRIRWEYDPMKIPDDASPLATTERWFRDFPWEGREDEDYDPNGSFAGPDARSMTEMRRS